MGTADGTTAWTPTPKILGLARRMLANRYRIQPEDIEDLISQAFVDCLNAPLTGNRGSDGLFFVIVRRRASDFWRRRKIEDSVEAGPLFSAPDREHLECFLIERALLRFVDGKKDLERRRVLGVARAVIQGARFAEACRVVGIPRGSQTHYREILKAFLAYLARLRSRGRHPGH